MAPIALAATLATSLLLGPLAATPVARTADPPRAAAGPATADPPAKGGRESWTVDLTAVDEDDAGVVASGTRQLRLAEDDAGAASAAEPRRTGVLVAPPRRLAAQTLRLTADVDATTVAGAEVLVDVRGRGTGQAWSEWVAAGERLDLPAVEVQVRLTLSAGPSRVSPVVRAVRVTAEPANEEPAVAAAGDPLSFRVFATREGLVGHTTANGHVIAQRDHFVALPSRRGLSPRGAGDYSVQVCAGNGRCAWAAVWDVGPWNTRDDYWNLSAVRQNWADLARGLPQAQAALQHGYNGGRDQYNRTVRNPAGIDLADGTFWDALRLTNNTWVTVTYLWTGGPATMGTIRTAGVPLNVRVAPDTTSAPVGLAGNKAQVRVECHVRGQVATGTQGTTDVWLRIAPGRYVSAAHVAAPPTPTCG